MSSGKDSGIPSLERMLSTTPQLEDPLHNQMELDSDITDHTPASQEPPAFSGDINHWITDQGSSNAMDGFQSHLTVGEIIPLLGFDDAVPSGITQSSPTSQRSSNKEPKPSKTGKSPTYSDPNPSNYCHICSHAWRPGTPHVICGNLLVGTCRKAICTDCFDKYKWDLSAARHAPPGSWLCTHCRGVCPERAQCVVYNRFSERRRLERMNSPQNPK